MGGEKAPNRFAARVPAKVPITEINQYLMCQLCSGYLVDATAIIECQHTFCKSCILKYLDTNSYCPICDVQLNKAKPHLSLRADTTLQKLVYKMVPGLLVTEVRRRKEHQTNVTPEGGSASTEEGAAAATASAVASVEPDEAEDLCVLSIDDAVSLSLEYYKSSGAEDALASVKKCTSGDKANDRRYLQCPAAVSVGLLKKFIRMKYGLSDDYRVDLLYNGDRDNILEDDLTLLDVAVMYKWKKTEPMCFHYRIFDRPVKTELVWPGSKRTASSMMDEPPDDDEASGTPNSSMTSASPSKLPRLSEASSNNTGSQGGGTGSSSGGSNSGGKKSSASHPTTSDVVPMDTSSSGTTKRSDVRSAHGGTRSRSQSMTSEKDNEKEREASPPQTRSSLTLKLSKRLAKVRRSSNSSSGSIVGLHDHAISHRNATSTSVREAVEKIVLSKKQPERKLSDSSTSPTSSSGSDFKESPPSLKISLKNPNLYHVHHHHKHKHKSKDRNKHKHHKGSSSPKHHHHKGNKTHKPARADDSPKEVSDEEEIKEHSKQDGKASGQAGKSSQLSMSMNSNVGGKTTGSNSNVAEKEANKSNATLPVKKPESSKVIHTPEDKKNNSSVPISHKQQPHPLVPESVQMQVPKSVTLIPVNPNAPNIKRNTNVEKNTAVNRNTFTHPITNKSLHQITVTEVPPPPPPKTSSSTVPTPTSSTTTSSSSYTSSTQPNKHNFEATSNSSKPFTAPDSMEITKIYCDNSGKAFDAGKKLKERKGLDITISPSPAPQNKPRKLDDSLTFTTKFAPTKGVKQPLIQTGTSGLPKNLNLKGNQLPGIRNFQTGNKPESATKNRKSSVSIEATKPGIEKNSISSAHRKAIGNLDSSIAIYEVGSLQRTPSPPKEKGLVVTPIVPHKETIVAPKAVQNKRLEPTNKHLQQQLNRQHREEVKEKNMMDNKKREKSGTEHDSPLDLSGKSSRSPTENKSERFPSPRPPTPVHSPSPVSALPSPDRQKSKQQSSAAQTQTILSIAQNLAQKQQLQLQQQQKQQQQQQQKQRSSPLPPQLPPNTPKSSASLLSTHAQCHTSAAIASLAHSLSSSMIAMPTPSPPGSSFNPLRNLVTLSDAASCLRKLQNNSLNTSINQLVAAAAAGLCGPQQQPPVSSSIMSPPASQMLPPPRSSLMPSSMTMRPGPLPPTLGSPSSGTLSLPPNPNLLSPDSTLAGMPWASGLNPLRSMMPPPRQGLTAGSLSPPMNPFLSGLVHTPVSSTASSVRPVTALRIPNVNPKSGKDTLTSRSSVLSTPCSTSSALGKWSPMMGIYSSSSLSKSLPDNNKSLISNPISSSASHILRSSSLSSRPTKLNGNISSGSVVPSSSASTTTFVAPSAVKSSKAPSVSSKNAIPNSMKISNFLPPPQSKSNGSSNAPATITSSSSLAKYFSSMPPLLPPQSPPSTSSNNTSDKKSPCPPLSMSSLSSSFAFPLNSSTISSPMANLKFRSSSPPPGSSARTLPVSKTTTLAATANATGSDSKPDFTLSINCETGRSNKNIPSSKSPTKSALSGTTGRSSQPLNQAVRHIPNPSLLLNRQSHNSSCQTQNNSTVNNETAVVTVPKVSPTTNNSMTAESNVNILPCGTKQLTSAAQQQNEVLASAEEKELSREPKSEPQVELGTPVTNAEERPKEEQAEKLEEPGASTKEVESHVQAESAEPAEKNEAKVTEDEALGNKTVAEPAAEERIRAIQPEPEAALVEPEETKAERTTGECETAVMEEHARTEPVESTAPHVTNEDVTSKPEKDSEPDCEKLPESIVAEPMEVDCATKEIIVENPEVATPEKLEEAAGKSNTDVEQESSICDDKVEGIEPSTTEAVELENTGIMAEPESSTTEEAAEAEPPCITQPEICIVAAEVNSEIASLQSDEEGGVGTEKLQNSEAATAESLPEKETIEPLSTATEEAQPVEEPETPSNDSVLAVAEEKGIQLENSGEMEIVADLHTESAVASTAESDQNSSTVDSSVVDAVANEVCATGSVQNETTEIEMTAATAIVSPPTQNEPELIQGECPDDSGRDEVAIEHKLNEIKDTTNIIAADDTASMVDVKDFDENSDELIIDTKTTLGNDEAEILSSNAADDATFEIKSVEIDEVHDGKEEIEFPVVSEEQQPENIEDKKDEEEEEETVIAGAIEESSGGVSLEQPEISHPEPMEIDDVSPAIHSESSLPSVEPNAEAEEGTSIKTVQEESETVPAEPIQTHIENDDADIDTDNNNAHTSSPVQPEVPAEDEQSATQVNDIEAVALNGIKREVMETEEEEEHMEIESLLENFNALQNTEVKEGVNSSMNHAEDEQIVSNDVAMEEEEDARQIEQQLEDTEKTHGDVLEKESNYISSEGDSRIVLENDEDEIMESKENPTDTPSRPDSPSIKVDLKKMENLEKVAAGLLASAANSINNNNNNSFASGVGVPCDLGVGTATTTA